MSTGVDSHRDKFAVISFLDFVEITESVLDRCDVVRRDWRRDRNLFCIFARAQAVGGCAVVVVVVTASKVLGVMRVSLRLIKGVS
jgi:hypothetical protein